MEAPIVEIFSSIQGEGLLIGRRQIFVRFAGCNLDCNYCDTSKSKSVNSGTNLTVNEVVSKINDLKTSDLHSVSFTGGEPLLYVDFINEVISKLNVKTYLETNGTLPNELNKLDSIDYVALDIKLPEHFNNVHYENILNKEIKSLNLLVKKSINVYCKIVVFPSTELSVLEDITKKLFNGVIKSKEMNIVIQPVSPISQWKGCNNKLFDFSQCIGKYMDVVTIPQVHKFLNIE